MGNSLVQLPGQFPVLLIGRDEGTERNHSCIKKNTWQMRKISWLQPCRSRWRNSCHLKISLLQRRRSCWRQCVANGKISWFQHAAALVGPNTWGMRISWLQGRRYGWRQHVANENQLVTAPPPLLLPHATRVIWKSADWKVLQRGRFWSRIGWSKSNRISWM